MIPLIQHGEDPKMPETFYEYMVFYQKYAINWWNHLGPRGYIVLLSLVGIIGYITMLRGPKRIS